MEEKIVIKNYKDVPILSVSLQSTLPNKTGTWRYLRPSYVRLQAPCSNACPLGQDISFYLTSLADGKPEEAWKKILEANPFPAVCGRVCHHPCETDCNRKEYDEKERGATRKGKRKAKRSRSSAGAPPDLPAPTFWRKEGMEQKSLKPCRSPGACCATGFPPTACRAEP
jgi:hypothetical protein